MTVLLIAGSPSERSRSSALLKTVALRLTLHHALDVDCLDIRNLDARALLHADFAHADVQRALEQVAHASAVVVATPVYKAAYSGALKVLLDVLPQNALKGKAVLPLATGGSPHHMLALDYALRPVLQSLAAWHILPGVYAIDSQVSWTSDGSHHLIPDIAVRLEEAVDAMVDAIAPSHSAPYPPSCTPGFAPIDFSQVQHSV